MSVNGITFSKSIVNVNGVYKCVYVVLENGIEIGSGSCPKNKWESVKLSWLS